MILSVFITVISGHDKPQPPGCLLDKAWADGTAASLAGKPATVEAAATDDKKTAAPLPFNLVRLQQYMNKKFKMTAQKTLDITQQLREKYGDAANLLI
nr:DNA topoisomerase 3 [Escherichia coli]